MTPELNVLVSRSFLAFTPMGSKMRGPSPNVNEHTRMRSSFTRPCFKLVFEESVKPFGPDKCNRSDNLND